MLFLDNKIKLENTFRSLLIILVPHGSNNSYPCYGFLVTSPLGFKARVGFCLICIAEANVIVHSLRSNSGATHCRPLDGQHCGVPTGFISCPRILLCGSSESQTLDPSNPRANHSAMCPGLCCWILPVIGTSISRGFLAHLIDFYQMCYCCRKLENLNIFNENRPQCTESASMYSCLIGLGICTANQRAVHWGRFGLNVRNWPQCMESASMYSTLSQR